MSPSEASLRLFPRLLGRPLAGDVAEFRLGGAGQWESVHPGSGVPFGGAVWARSGWCTWKRRGRGRPSDGQGRCSAKETVQKHSQLWLINLIVLSSTLTGLLHVPTGWLFDAYERGGSEWMSTSVPDHCQLQLFLVRFSLRSASVLLGREQSFALVFQRKWNLQRRGPLPKMEVKLDPFDAMSFGMSPLVKEIPNGCDVVR